MASTEASESPVPSPARHDTPPSPGPPQYTSIKVYDHGASPVTEHEAVPLLRFQRTNIPPSHYYHSDKHRPVFRFYLATVLVMVAIPAFILSSTSLSTILDPWSAIQKHLASDKTLYTEPREPYTSIDGPVVTSNFPDPAVISVNGTYYAFATNNRLPKPGLIHVPISVSTDYSNWTVLAGQDALPDVGPWAREHGIWAPSVVQLNNGKFVMYYSGNVKTHPRFHCVSAATSDHPEGPYIPLQQPLTCDIKAGGSIDPQGFEDPKTGRRYVVYKVDGNSLGHGGSCMNTVAPIVPTPLMLQEVDAEDGITNIGEPVELLDRDQGDGPLVEAPALHYEHELDLYYLFFSSGCFTGDTYDVKYATSKGSILGPYQRAQKPLVNSHAITHLIGPGGLDLLANSNKVVFHAIMTEDRPKFVRGMWVGDLTFDEEGVASL